MNVSLLSFLKLKRRVKIDYDGIFMTLSVNMTDNEQVWRNLWTQLVNCEAGVQLKDNHAASWATAAIVTSKMLFWESPHQQEERQWIREEILHLSELRIRTYLSPYCYF